MSFGSLIEVGSPTPLRYLFGATIMMIGVVLPVGYMMFRNKRVASSSSYSKLANKGFMKISCLLSSSFLLLVLVYFYRIRREYHKHEPSQLCFLSDS